MAPQPTARRTNNDLLYLIKRMAEDMRAMQKALYQLPPAELRAHLERMERHAAHLSYLASLLEGRHESTYAD